MSFLGPFAMTFLIVLFLLLMQFLWRYIDELVGKGLGIEIIGEFLMYASAGLVPLALPLAVLLSSLMTFGNMGEYYELTAIKASGISLQRVMLPVVFLVLLISGFAFFFANNVVPITNLKMRTLRLDVKNLHPEVSITEGVFNKGIEDFIIRVSRKDPVNNLLYDIKIYDHSGPRGNPDVTIADSGRIKMTEDKRNMIITLWDGYKYTEKEESKRRRDRKFPHQMMKFKEQNIIIQVSGFELSRSDERIFKSSYQMLDIVQLKHAHDSLKRDMEYYSRDYMRSIVKNSFFKSGKIYVSKFPAGHQRMYADAHTPEEIRENALPKTDAKQLKKVALRQAAAKTRDDLRQAAGTIPQDTLHKRDTLPVVAAGAKKITDFDSLFASFSIDDREEMITLSISQALTNANQLQSSAQRMSYESKRLRKHQIEWHRKFTLSLACLIFLFIGAPLGAIIRKGGLGLPTVISTLLFILYYVISLIGQKFVEEDILSSFQGMWMSSFVLVIAGIFLTYQATNDSAILNVDTYFNWIREKAGLRKGLILEKKAHILGKFELTDIPRPTLQENFKSIGEMAGSCLVSLKEDDTLLTLAKKSFANSGFTYLLEFGIHYNSLIDQIMLSKWFRIPYFEKRLLEFPMISGRITSGIFTRKSFRVIAAVIFPIAIVRLIHLKFKLFVLKRNLNQVIGLSAGMINLLNSSALKFDADEL